MNILHLINDLRVGGTERSLVNYCLNDRKNKNYILTFGNSDSFEKELKKKNIEVVKIHSSKNIFKIIFQMKKIAKKFEINIIHSWMYHSHLISLVYFFFGYKIFWSIRNQNISKKNLGFKTYYLVKILSFLSKLIAKNIFYNSHFAQTTHINGGFSNKVGKVIFNGFDKNFNSNLVIQDSILDKLKKFKAQNHLIILSVGRYHPVKNQELLINSLSDLKKRTAKFICIFVGKGFNKNNYKLNALIENLQLNENIILIDYFEKMNQLYSNSDITVLTSKNESFPNVLGESMVCGTPCISTDVGDVRKLISSSNGWIIQSNKDNLLKILEKVIDLKKNDEQWLLIKQNCMKKIKNNFSFEKMYENFEEGYLIK